MGRVTVELTVRLVHMTALPLFTCTHAVSLHSRPTNKSHNHGSGAQFVSPRTLTVALRRQGCGRPWSRGDRDSNVDRSEATARRPQSRSFQEEGPLRCIETSRILKVSSSSCSTRSSSNHSRSRSRSRSGRCSRSTRKQAESSIVPSCPMHS